MRMNCFDRRTLMVLSLTLSSGFSKFSAIVRPAYMVLSWITLRIREALRGGRHERERLESLEPKDTVERFWGLIFIGLPYLSDETPKPVSSDVVNGWSLLLMRRNIEYRFFECE